MIISRFKAQCIAVIREAQRTHEAVLITRRGRPVARVEPVYDEAATRKLGALKGRMRIKGDIVHADFEDDWEHPA
mgnify:CR=1 FL=1